MLIKILEWTSENGEWKIFGRLYDDGDIVIFVRKRDKKRYVTKGYKEYKNNKEVCNLRDNMYSWLRHAWRSGVYVKN